MKTQTKVITDESQVPPGFVPMSRWEKDRVNHKRLSDAHNDGKLHAVKLIRFASEARTGKVWVHEEDAIRLLAEMDSDKTAKAPTREEPPTIPSGTVVSRLLAEHAADIRISLTLCTARLADMYDVLETIARATEATAKAVEELATKPITPQQELLRALNSNGSWRDMNDESH